MKIIRNFTIALILMTIFVAQAMANNPIAMLEGVKDNVITALKEHRSVLESEPAKIFNLAEKYIVPHVDFEEMAMWVAGRNAWRKASENVKQEFVHEFKILVVRTYAMALKKYSDETIVFLPYKGAQDKRIQVSSKIIKSNNETLRIDYRLISHTTPPGGQWKVYDMIIEGVSILQGYQAQFSDKIRRDGLQTVIEDLKKHNQELKSAK